MQIHSFLNLFSLICLVGNNRIHKGKKIVGPFKSVRAGFYYTNKWLKSKTLSQEIAVKIRGNQGQTIEKAKQDTKTYSMVGAKTT